MFDVEVVASDRVSSVKTRDVARRTTQPAAAAHAAAGGHDRLPDAVGLRRRGDRGRGAARRASGCSHRRRGVHARADASIRSARRSSAWPTTRRARRRRCSRSRSATAPSSCRSPRPGPTTGISLGSGRDRAPARRRACCSRGTRRSSSSPPAGRATSSSSASASASPRCAPSTLQNYDMKDYDVLVLPSGNYNFSDDALRRLKDWIRNGGTLITIAEASRWAARDRVGLLSTDTLLRDGSPRARRAGGAAGGRRPSGGGGGGRSRTRPSRSTSRRRSSPSASSPRTSPARCCASRCIRITGSPPGSTAVIRRRVRR